MVDYEQLVGTLRMWKAAERFPAYALDVDDGYRQAAYADDLVQAMSDAAQHKLPVLQLVSLRNEDGVPESTLTAAICVLESLQILQSVSEAPPATAASRLQSLPDDAMMHPVDLAAALGLPAEALRKRLDRWRKRNEDGWQETTEPRAGEPRYVYRESAV